MRVGAVRMSLPVLDEKRRGTRFYQHAARSIINPPESTGMGFWSINPYVGCEFGCTYCYARFAHHYVVERARDDGLVEPAEVEDLRGPNGWEAFEYRIFVKRRDDVLDALERDIPRVRRRAETERQSLAIGTATDPYQPAERTFGVTRAILNRLRYEAGFGVGIITKSPLVRRDIDLLSALDTRHDLTVHVSLITADDQLIRRFEPRSPLPHARLRGLQALVEAGINAGLIVAPVLPGITDTSDRIRKLLEAARAVGARFAVPVPLRLYPAVRAPFLPVIKRDWPELVPRYEAAYRDALEAPEDYRAQLRERFARIANEVGIALRSEPRGRSRQPVEQMDMWGEAEISRDRAPYTVRRAPRRRRERVMR